MKRLILTGISALLLAAAYVPAVTAQTTALNTTLRSTYTRALTPFNLVTFADRGYFKEQGIPAHAILRSAYNFGQIDATNIVQAAVKANRLDPQFLDDQSYLSAVEAQLSSLENAR